MLTFMNKDPIGFSGGFNLYAYAGHNPINWIDPSGSIAVIEILHGILHPGGPGALIGGLVLGVPMGVLAASVSTPVVGIIVGLEFAVIGAEIGGQLFDQPWAGEPGYDEVSWLREREIEQVKWEIQEWRKISSLRNGIIAQEDMLQNAHKL
jgi:hypothetical protein